VAFVSVAAALHPTVRPPADAYIELGTVEQPPDPPPDPPAPDPCCTPTACKPCGILDGVQDVELSRKKLEELRAQQRAIRARLEAMKHRSR
jgi:hypothetical protein